MCPVRPSEKEEEYFARQEYERLQRLAAERRSAEVAEERRQRRELHHMHCPKCGGDLFELDFKSVKIDKCTDCEGIWLDAGELDQVLKEEDLTLMRRVLKAFR